MLIHGYWGQLLNKIILELNCTYLVRDSNVIVKQCINLAMYHSNSDLGYKFAFYRYAYNIDVFCTMKYALSKLTVNESWS